LFFSPFIQLASFDDWQLRLHGVHGLAHVGDPYSEWLSWEPVVGCYVDGGKSWSVERLSQWPVNHRDMANGQQI